MSTDMCSAVLLTVLLVGLFRSTATAYDVVTLTEEELKAFVAQTEFVLVLYSPVPCTSTECYNINEMFPVISASLATHKVKCAAINDVHTQKLVFYRNAVPILFDGIPALFDASPVTVDEVVVWVNDNMQSYTLSLNDDNFEHETQASTGATTGDWFVRFYKSDCADETAVWEAVASRLRGRIIIASVDLETSGKLEKRFKIKQCPTFILFHHGNMYRYELPMTTVMSLESFVDGWYKNARSKPVPAQPTAFDALTDTVVDILKTTLESNSVSSWLVVAVIFLLLVAAILVLCCLQTSGKQKFD